MTVAPLTDYLGRPMTAPAPEVTDAIAAGPIDPADALGRDELDRLLDPTPGAAETGWCTLPDGVGYAAVRTEMPAVSAEMVDWWFDWHPREPVRYQLWFPGAHETIHFDPPPGEPAKRHWDAVHFPTEDVGLGMTPLRIAFQPPSRLGFSSDGLRDPRLGTIVAGLVGDARRRIRHTLMAHVFLAAERGLVLRSRFWMGAVLRPEGSAPGAALLGRALNRRAIRRRAIPAKGPRLMAEHCAAEYANLAALLPELYRERAGAPVG